MLSPRYDYFVSREPILPMDDVQKRARDTLAAKLEGGRYSLVDHACPVCNSRKYEPLASRDRYGLPSDVAICLECGLVQGSPYLSKSSLDEFYTEDFPTLHRSSNTPTEEKFRERRRYAAGIVYWLQQKEVRTEGRLLDVGCSSGGILQGFVDAGFDGYGVELNPVYASYAREKGLKAEQGTLRDVLGSVKPDIITYCQVLEHIPNIHQELSTLQCEAAGETLIYIEVPGLKKLWPTYHFDFLRYLQLAHVWHFSLETLTALMNRYGFRLVAGDQHVRALFMRDRSLSPSELKSDYNDAVKSLRRSERIRKIYPVNAIRRAWQLRTRLKRG